MAGIYIHIPFCKSKCGYCDFYSLTCTERVDATLDAINKELHYRKDFLGIEPVKTIYFGGGTPSLCEPKRLQEIIDTIKDLWGTTGVTEITAEANPDDLSDIYLKKLADTDINRLSIGIQSFSDRDLLFMNRRHNAEEAINAVKRAQEAGFDNISVDLIFGIPGMSAEDWLENIKTALDLGIQHISSYHLIIEEGTPFGNKFQKGTLTPVKDKISEEQYLLLHETLTKGGFEHYEISNFALSGFRAAHNSSYWSGELYLGVGPSAHSYDGERRHSVKSSVKDYIEDAGKENIYTIEVLTENDKYNELIMTSLRRIEGLDSIVLRTRFGNKAFASFIQKAQKYLEKGILRKNGTHYAILPDKFLISDSVISDFFI